MNNIEVKCNQIDPTTVEFLVKLNAVPLSWLRSQMGFGEEIAVREPCNAEKFILAIED